MEKKQLSGLANGLLLAGTQSDLTVQYDNCCKHFLANRELLAYILKATVEEYRDYTVKEIEQWIEPEIEIGEAAVDMDFPDRMEAEKLFIEGSSQESGSIVEGSRFFDLKFSAVVPKEKTRKPGNREYLKLILNVEAQKTSDSSKLHYKLEKRIVYYLSRLISGQYQREFAGSEYNKIKKVYSIWICMNCEENAISELRFQERDIYGQGHLDKKACDLATGVVVKLKTNYEKDPELEHQLMEILNVLFSPNIRVLDKMEILNEQGLTMTENVKKDVNEMCNLSQAVLEQGIEQGVEQGIKQGRAKEIVEMGYEFGISEASILKRLQKKLEVSKEEAQNYLKMFGK